MQGFVEGAMYVSQGKIKISTEGMLVTSGPVTSAWAYLTVKSTIRSLILLVVKIFCKDINPKGRRYLHLGESNQQKSPGAFKKPAWPVFCSCFVK